MTERDARRLALDWVELSKRGKLSSVVESEHPAEVIEQLGELATGGDDSGLLTGTGWRIQIK